MKNINIDFSKCSDKCEGMDIITYDQIEIDSKMARAFSKLYSKEFKSRFEKNPTLTRYISKLSDQYNKYKETYGFSTKYKGSGCVEMLLDLRILGQNLGILIIVDLL